ncbi:MAG TPA: toll/interleukin-1 receptor domain-containing protein [Candidatus Methylacidiphilales bacterium]|nr:toll/interleukin-1 receptor domain-containing protein [Candidatus Methylacidiphilales bacterium]
MTSSDSTTIDLHKLLFISYAYEDQVFAKWLARKLAFYGYGVWIDQIEILGGESWVKEVDVAIKDRSFRVLGLLSAASLAKDNPRKERTLALQLGKQRNIDDFLITLKLDGTQPDWTLSDISWIPFHESWADGLRRILKKLDALNAPKIHAGNLAIAKAALDRGTSLMVNKSEMLTTNWLSFSHIPEVVSIFDTSRLEPEKEKVSRDLWSKYGFEPGRAAAFSPPPPEIASIVTQTRESFHWPSVETIHDIVTHNVISSLLKRAVHVWLIRAGCVVGADFKSYYLPSPFRGEAIYRFKDTGNKSSYIRTTGSVRLYRPNSAPEEIIHHPSIRYSIRKTDLETFVVQLRPGVALFDHAHAPITGRKVGPRTKKVTRAYFNEKWRKRLLAFTQLLLQAAGQDAETTLRLGGLIDLSTDWCLDESTFNIDIIAETEEPVQEDVEVTPEEMEDTK